jgi:hypothetical protein
MILSLAHEQSLLRKSDKTVHAGHQKAEVASRNAHAMLI